MTLTKRDLVIRISGETGLTQGQVFDVVQKTLDYIAEALAKGDKVELRNFGVFEIKVRKARVGRNPNKPEADVPIPARATVKFKAGKEMRIEVLKLTPESRSPKSLARTARGFYPSGMERLPGFRDFYPEPLPHADVWSADARQFIFEKWRAVARRYNFREYDGPPLESLELFTTKSGEEIAGQLYNFTDKGDRAVALRPEMTPTLARMIAAHERNYKKPIKWFAIPQLFRYERQQKGRLREHFQFNADLIGESDPAADAELIALLIDALRAFGLTEKDFVIRLSSRNAWQEFYKAGKRRRSTAELDEYDFFQIIDKLERTPKEESEKKLAALGFSLAEVNQFIESGKPTAELESILRQSRRARPAGFCEGGLSRHPRTRLLHRRRV